MYCFFSPAIQTIKTEMTLPKKSAESLDLGRFGNTICNNVLFLIGLKKIPPKILHFILQKCALIRKKKCQKHFTNKHFNKQPHVIWKNHECDLITWFSDFRSRYQPCTL